MTINQLMSLMQNINPKHTVASPSNELTKQTHLNAWHIYLGIVVKGTDLSAEVLRD